MSSFLFKQTKQDDLVEQKKQTQKDISIKHQSSQKKLQSFDSKDEQEMQVQMLKQVEDLLRQNEELKEYTSSQELKRYLIAREYKLERASQLLRTSLQWRIKEQTWQYRWDQFREEGKTGKVFVANFRDVKDDPIIIMRPRDQNTKDYIGQTKLFYYMVNQATKLSDKIGTGKTVWFVDFEKFSLRTSPPANVAIECLNTLQNCFPERLDKAICWRAPTIFNILWSIVYPCLDNNTKKKIEFWNPGPQEEQLLKQRFGDDHKKLFEPFNEHQYSQEMAHLDQLHG